MVFIAKCRRKVLYGELRKQLGPLFRTLAEHKESAIQIARRFLEVKRNFVGQHFWARGYFVSTVGRDETVIRADIRAQEVEDQQAEQLRLQ